jgi:hypothetical protein
MSLTVTSQYHSIRATFKQEVNGMSESLLSRMVTCLKV